MSSAKCNWASCSAVMGAAPPPPAGTATATPSSKGRTAASVWSGSRPGTARTTPANSPRGYIRFQAQKLALDVPPPAPDAPPDAFPETSRRNQEGAVYIVERRGADVAVIEGFPEGVTGSLLDTAIHATKTEMTFLPAPPTH